MKITREVDVKIIEYSKNGLVTEFKIFNTDGKEIFSFNNPQTTVNFITTALFGVPPIQTNGGKC